MRSNLEVTRLDATPGLSAGGKTWSLVRHEAGPRCRVAMVVADKFYQISIVVAELHVPAVLTFEEKHYLFKLPLMCQCERSLRHLR